MSDPDTLHDALRAMTLVVTSQCNLRCSYCYQDDKRPGVMSLEVANAAVGRLLASPRRDLHLAFWGGEPLLELDLVRRIVAHVAERRRPDQRVHYAISTNGTLLDAATASFLARHRFDIQLSFDAVPAAQRHRGAGTFAVVHRRLDDLARDHPGTFRERLTVAITVHPGNVTLLPEAVEALLGRGIRAIALAPVITATPGWRPEDIAGLERAFARIVDSSLRYLRVTGRVPVTLLRPARPPARGVGVPREAQAAGGGALCGIARPSSMTVDVDGMLYGCTAVAASMQRLDSELLRERVAPLALGSVAAADLGDRLAAYPGAVARAALFHDRQQKHSVYGRCIDCEHRRHCAVCPVAIAHAPDHRDPHRIPDFLCAFNRVALACRADVVRRLEPAARLAGGGLSARRRAFETLVGVRRITRGDTTSRDGTTSREPVSIPAPARRASPARRPG